MQDDQESSQNPTEPDAGGDQPSVDNGAAPESTGEPEVTEQADELAASALASAQAAISALSDEDEDAGAETVVESAGAVDQSGGPSGVNFPDFSAASIGAVPKGMDLLSDVSIDVTIELGRTHMLVEDVLRLAEGAVVELDKLAGDPVDIYVNQRLVARGEVLVLNDNFCIRVNDILDADLVEQDV
jgi:flagellar motor switch protein FliN/FliY